MKRAGLVFERKSQVLIAVLIAFTIMLTLGVAIMMHSRAGRTSARIQTEEQKAYQLAQSGIAIGESFLKDNPTGSLNKNFNIGGGDVTVTAGSGLVRSESDYQGVNKTITKNVGPSTPPPTTWAKSYGGMAEDRDYFVANTSDGGYFLSGTVQLGNKNGYGAGARDIMAIKTDKFGNVTWASAFGGAKEELIYDGASSSAAIVPSGGYICTSSSTSFSKSGQDILLVKVKGDGTMGWARGFTGGNTDIPYAVLAALDGGYLVAAKTNTNFANVEGKTIKGYAMLLIKTDENGHIGSDANPVKNTWVKLYDNQIAVTDTDEYPWGLAEDTNYYYLVGESKHVDFDGVILKINKGDGSIAQQKRLGTPKPIDERFIGFSLIPGGFVITGEADGYDTTTGKNALFIKLDSDFNPVGTGKLYDEELLTQRGKVIKPTSSGGYAIGATCEGSSVYDWLLIQTDSNGNLPPTKAGSRRIGQWTGQIYETFNSLDVTSDGGLILGGYATQEYIPGGTWMNFLIVKTDSLGGFSSTLEMSRPPVNLTQTDFVVEENTEGALANLTVSVGPTNLDDSDQGPAPGNSTIFYNSAAGIQVVGPH